jgi:hypothetical protein
MDYPEIKGLIRRIEDIDRNGGDDRAKQLSTLGLALSRLNQRVQSRLCIGYVDLNT